MNRRVSIDRLSLTLANGATFENIVSQIQPYLSDSLLVVKNGEELVVHTTGDCSKFPIYIQLEAQRGDIYYFRDKVSEDLYAVFGGEAASIFCPSLNLGGFKRKIASISEQGEVTTIVDCDIKPAELVDLNIII